MSAVLPYHGDVRDGSVRGLPIKSKKVRHLAKCTGLMILCGGDCGKEAEVITLENRVYYRCRIDWWSKDVVSRNRVGSQSEDATEFRAALEELHSMEF